MGLTVSKEKLCGEVNYGAPGRGFKATFLTTKTSEQVVEIFTRHFYSKYPIEKSMKLELYFTNEIDLLVNKISDHWIRFAVEFDNTNCENFYVTYFSETELDVNQIYDAIGEAYEEIRKN